MALMVQSPEWSDLQWIPPKSYSTGRPSGPPRFITVHYTAGHEGYLDAENGALYDQRRTDGTSSHYYCDADSVVQCVRTADRSHTALYHGNLWGIHYELAGTAQTRAQWLDVISRATIRRAAKQMARDMQKYGIPLQRVVTTELRDAARKGICGHYDWTYGWPEDGGTHTDPGPQFPWDVLLDDIREFLTGDTDVNLTDPLPGTSTTVGAALAELYLSRGGRGQIQRITGDVETLVKAAGEEVQRDAAEAASQAAMDAEILAAVKAVDPDDTDALRDLLARIQVTVRDV